MGLAPKNVKKNDRLARPHHHRPSWNGSTCYAKTIRFSQFNTQTQWSRRLCLLTVTPWPPPATCRLSEMRAREPGAEIYPSTRESFHALTQKMGPRNLTIVFRGRKDIGLGR